MYILFLAFPRTSFRSHVERRMVSLFIKNNRCSIYQDEVYYGSSCMMNDLYIQEIEKPVFNITNK